MLSLRTIEPHTLELLKALMQEPALCELRLVGGTALALQYGHRSSIDLDLFGKIDIDAYELQEILSKHGMLRVENETKIIHQYIIDNIKVDVVNYPFEWITPMIEDEGVRLASPMDIAAMKVNAIEGRGTKKDFIDMYMLLQHYSLEEILGFYQQKYPNHSVFRALRSLTYFEDAEDQFMPRMFVDDTWEDIKQLIVNKVKTIKL
ncbi:MAG: nucleotidyl transferase AbiEii/AbiGii toxin family protein [Paludibacteraceae bacterium]|nr:nucleotidyl transferase AbiEii/AbiGii toxin family protein [Paludibacteraceae bacterium]